VLDGWSAAVVAARVVVDSPPPQAGADVVAAGVVLVLARVALAVVVGGGVARQTSAPHAATQALRLSGRRSGESKGGGHGAHADAPAASTKVPGGHASHADAAPAANVPDAHAAHAVPPGVAEAVPGGHGAHGGQPSAVAAVVPGAHCRPKSPYTPTPVSLGIESCRGRAVAVIRKMALAAALSREGIGAEKG
jgi:hypothetical protein